MRIVGFVRIWPTHHPVGGMQIHARNLYRGLAARGHDVHVLTTAHPAGFNGCSEEHGIKVHYLSDCPAALYSEQYFHLAAQTLRAIDSETPVDIIHSESSCANRELLGKWPIVATWHGLEYCTLRTILNVAQARADNNRAAVLDAIPSHAAGLLREIGILRQYDQSIAISHQAYRDLSVVYQIPSIQRLLVFNGFDISHFRRDAGLRLETRRRYNIPTDIIVVGVAGRLVEDKGHLRLLSILPSLCLEDKKLLFLVVGDGPASRAYEQLQLDNVRYVGPITYEDMPAMYNAFDLLLNPTFRYGGLDMTIQEAMLCGVPVLATDVGSIKTSLLPFWRYGTTFSLCDEKDMIRKLRILTNRRDLKQLGTAASEYARQRFSLDQMCSGTEHGMDRAIHVWRKRWKCSNMD